MKRKFERDLQVAKMTDAGMGVDQIASEMFYHPNTVRVIRRRYRQSRFAAMAEIASRYPTEYNDLVEEFFAT